MDARAGNCTGAHDCTGTRHVHGCYADRGACDSPTEHGPQPSQALKDAVAFARRTDPDFPAKVKRLAEQDFNPLATIQRGIERQQMLADIDACDEDD